MDFMPFTFTPETMPWHAIMMYIDFMSAKHIKASALSDLLPTGIFVDIFFGIRFFPMFFTRMEMVFGMHKRKTIVYSIYGKLTLKIKCVKLKLQLNSHVNDGYFELELNKALRMD